MVNKHLFPLTWRKSQLNQLWVLWPWLLACVAPVVISHWFKWYYPAYPSPSCSTVAVPLSLRPSHFRRIRMPTTMPTHPKLHSLLLSLKSVILGLASPAPSLRRKRNSKHITNQEISTVIDSLHTAIPTLATSSQCDGIINTSPPVTFRSESASVWDILVSC
jgi:hypothetical protein